ncbi:hypothetical protein ACQUFY_26550 (plasmid) [Robbsia andropogonis]|uniref:hypothetical protein n=1 Tax=Robbsia andropogonis TaxID=28092 RepID=UPI003D1EC454
MSDQKAELQIGEWCIRMMCKFFAFGAVILGLCGCAVISFRLVLPMIESANYGTAALTGIALIAAMLFGLAPMGVEIDKVLLRLCGGLQPLPSRKDH